MSGGMLLFMTPKKRAASSDKTIKTKAIVTLLPASFFSDGQ